MPVQDVQIGHESVMKAHTSTTPTEIGLVFYVNHLESVLNSAQEAFDVLAKHLHPLTIPMNSGMAQDTQAPQPARSAIEQAIVEQIALVESLTGRIHALREMIKM